MTRTPFLAGLLILATFVGFPPMVASSTGLDGDTPIGAVEIAAGGRHTCALMTDGTARCWGSGGRVGDGTTTSRSTPVAVLANVVQISAGADHSCAVLTDGTAQCWGSNNFGQLGDGSHTSRATPVDVLGLTDVVQIAAGTFHSCAVRADQTAWCWGDNSRGQLGDGTRTSRSSPRAVTGLGSVGIVQIDAGTAHSCARAGGMAVCWGGNSAGQLGDGTILDSSSPVLVQGLLTAAQIATGYFHSCAVLTDGTARCWGSNFYGELGSGDLTGGLALDFHPLPLPVQGLSNAAQISAGSSYSCAALTDGTARCWGRNSWGQLGDGTTTDRLTPTVVQDLSTVVQIAAGDEHSCAVLTDRTARCWGLGPLGDGTWAWSSTPVEVKFDSRPDLLLSSGPTMTPSSPREGDGVTFSAVVSNTGDTDAGSFALRFLIDDAPLGGDVTLPGLIVGASTTVTQSWTSTAGTHTVRVVADSASQVAESNEANNDESIVINVALPPTPDLVVSSLTVSPPSPVAGDAVMLTATLNNQGPGAGGPFNVEFFVDGASLGTVSVSSLTAGASTTVSKTWTAVAGTHTIRAVADPANQVPESNEANNDRSATINVSGVTRGVDLSPPSQSKTVPSKGTAVYDLVVKNTGTASDTILLSTSGSKSGWSSSLSASSVTLAPGASATVQLTVGAGNGGNLTVTVNGASQADASIKDTATCQTKVGK